MSTRITDSQNSKSKKRLEPRKKPVQGRSKASVEAILMAAAQVFEAHGYAAGTTNRIAERAGVSVGTLYQYFPSKEAIVVALLEEHLLETTRKLHEWVGHMVSLRHGLRDALADYVQGIMDVHETRPRLQHILLEEAPLPPRLHDLLMAADAEAVRTMGGLLRLYPEVGHADPESAAYLVIHTVESLTHGFAAHPDERLLDSARFVEELVSMLEAYLSCSPGSRATRL
ncbi:TetR/AcrR family transcriptional regulator [Myxococcota bacterium]|nr:TetR/AcrR family transcriptional regulator [Myxococcota bacterium]